MTLRPAPDEKGRWFRVYARQVDVHDKFRDLTAVELGAWLALRSEAELRDRACIRSRADALLALRRRRTPRPVHVLDRLVELRLFDVTDDGRIHVHDRADHDRSKYPSDDPEETRRRKAEQRRREQSTDANVHDSNESVTTRDGGDPTRDSHEVTIARARAPVAGAGAGAGAVSESLSDLERGVGETFDEADAAVAYHDATGRFPSPKVLEWLNRMSDDHPEEAIARVLAEQYASDPNPGTLLSRTDAALKLDQHRRNKADERARAKAQAAAEKPHREREREATPEEQEQAVLQRQAIRIGLQRGIEVPTDAGDVRKFVMKYGARSA